MVYLNSLYIKHRCLTFFASSALALACLWPSFAQAGIPECGGLRLEDAFSCEIQGDLNCEANCEDLSIYKKGLCNHAPHGVSR